MLKEITTQWSVLNDIFNVVNKDDAKHKIKQGNEYNVSDLLMCREKLRLIRKGETPNIVESDVSRQATLSKFVHKAVQIELEKLGWQCERKFQKNFGSYTVHCRVDGIKDDTIVEIKCPMYSVVNKRGAPDHYVMQIGIYLNITGAERCVLLILAKNGFHELTIDRPMSDDDIIFLIESGGLSPWYKRECETCYYKHACTVDPTLKNRG